MKVRELQKNDEENWDQFVDTMDEGTPFHKMAWKRVIDGTFNYPSLYLLAEKNGQINGILPLYHIRSPFAGNSFISVPFGVYGGLLADDLESEHALLETAGSYAQSSRADYIELHHRTPCQNRDLVTRDSLYYTFIKPIVASSEQNFNSLPKETRRQVRIGIKNDLVAVFDNSKIDDFYQIYAASVHNLGTPVFPRRLFKNCLKAFGTNAEIMTIYHAEKPVAGVLSFYFRETVMPYYGGALPEAKQLAPSTFMYWKLMEHAGEKGFKFFDFGRSKADTGAFNFKRHMGFSPTTLPYQYMLMNGERLPNNNPTNPKYQLMINLWRRIPLPLTKVFGPALIRYFP